MPQTGLKGLKFGWESLSSLWLLLQQVGDGAADALPPLLKREKEKDEKSAKRGNVIERLRLFLVPDVVPWNNAIRQQRFQEEEGTPRPTFSLPPLDYYHVYDDVPSREANTMLISATLYRVTYCAHTVRFCLCFVA